MLFNPNPNPNPNRCSFFFLSAGLSSGSRLDDSHLLLLPISTLLTYTHTHIHTHTHTHNSAQVFELDEVLSMAAELHVRVFASSVIKDSLLGELYLPLCEDLSLTATPTYLCGVRTEDVGWYMLYGRQRAGEEQVIVGKVQLGLTLH